MITRRCHLAHCPPVQHATCRPPPHGRAEDTLLRHARQWAREQGLDMVMAEATTKNYPALCFYQKLGFQFCGFNDHYYPNQDIALFFVQMLR